MNHMEKRMKLIGLTGGIGTGKSTVSAYLSKQGWHIVDADQISRSMTEKGEPCLHDIRKHFGAEVFLADGTLDRKKVSSLVFNDAEKKAELERIVTNRVIEEVFDQINNLKKRQKRGIIVLDAPLLFECGLKDYTDENWVVTADLESRIFRVGQRDGMDRVQIIARIANQMSSDEKVKMADFVIDNSGSLDALYRQLDSLIERVDNDC